MNSDKSPRHPLPSGRWIYVEDPKNPRPHQLVNWDEKYYDRLTFEISTDDPPLVSRDDQRDDIPPPTVWVPMW